MEPLLDEGYSLALAMVRDRDAAGDVLQEATIRAWRGFSRLRDRGAARTWFLAIVANEVRRMKRNRWESVEKTGEVESIASVLPPDVSEQHMDVRRALRSLDIQDRLPLALFYYLDLPMEDVAAVLGISVSAARGRVYRSVGRLRASLEKEVEG